MILCNLTPLVDVIQIIHRSKLPCNSLAGFIQDYLSDKVEWRSECPLRSSETESHKSRGTRK